MGIGRGAPGERATEWVGEGKQGLWEGKGERVFQEREGLLSEKPGRSAGVARIGEYLRERRFSGLIRSL